MGRSYRLVKFYTYRGEPFCDKHHGGEKFILARTPISRISDDAVIRLYDNMEINLDHIDPCTNAEMDKFVAEGDWTEISAEEARKFLQSRESLV